MNILQMVKRRLIITDWRASRWRVSVSGKLIIIQKTHISTMKEGEAVIPGSDRYLWARTKEAML